MNKLTPRIIKRFHDIYDYTNVNSVYDIWKQMNDENYKISIKSVKELLKEKRKEILFHITDHDENEDDEYNDYEYDTNYSDDVEEEKDLKTVKVIDAGLNMKVTPGLSVYLHAPLYHRDKILEEIHSLHLESHSCQVS